MLAENKDDDPVTFKVFNAFQRQIFERFDAMQKQLDEERKAREEERATREEEKAAREEEKKAREEEKKAREEEKKRREEAQDEIWKEMVEYNILGAIKKTIFLHYGMFIILVCICLHLFCEHINFVSTHNSKCRYHTPCQD